MKEHTEMDIRFLALRFLHFSNQIKCIHSLVKKNKDVQLTQPIDAF